MSLGTQLSDIFHERTNYDFIGPTKRWFAISGLFIIIGMAALGLRGGLTLGIDFKGGTAWEVKTQNKRPTSNGARDAVIGAGLIEPSIQLLGRPPDTIRVEAKRAPIDEQAKVRTALAGYANAKEADVSINDVGPTWGGEVSHKAIRALVFFFVAIAIYLSLRFEYKMAIAAIVAVIHDILITVVVFDKVEENVAGIGSTGRETYSGVVNRSMNQVLMRSLNTSFVAVLPVFSLLVVGAYLFGAVTIKDFSLALFIGLLTGAYSSIFVATPILALLKEREPRYAAIRQKLAGRAATVAAPAYASATAGGGGGAGGSARSGAGGGGGDDGAVETEKTAAAGSPRAAPRPVPTRRPGGNVPRPRQKRRKR